MENQIHINVGDRAVKYILFQRTAYLRFPENLLYRVAKRILPFRIYNIGVTLESYFGKERVKVLFNDDMVKEYGIIKRYLPKNCRTVLDIGCGVAGIDVLIHKHYHSRDIKFYLLDKTSIETNVFYMFEKRGAFYNSLSVDRELLILNGIYEDNIELLEATGNNDIEITEEIDFVISLISWGFHYPVSTYLDKVYEILAENGVLILDVRKGTDGKACVERKFAETQIIYETQKLHRMMAVK